MKQKGIFFRDQGDKGCFSYGKWKGKQVIHQWWNIKEFSGKRASFLQIQLLPSWFLGSAHSPAAGTETRGDICTVTGAGQPLHGTTELSFAGGRWAHSTVEIQRGPRGSEQSIDHHKRFPGVLPPSFGRMQNSTGSSAEQKEPVPFQRGNRAASITAASSVPPS